MDFFEAAKAAALRVRAAIMAAIFLICFFICRIMRNFQLFVNMKTVFIFIFFWAKKGPPQE